jgi:hypothetical protein
VLSYSWPTVGETGKYHLNCFAPVDAALWAREGPHSRGWRRLRGLATGLFTDLAWLFPKYTKRTTLDVPVCGYDTDLKRFVKLHAAPRAGLFDPYTVVDGIDTIFMKGLESNHLV